jgi:site-specific DNA-cytosine methylase
VNVAPRPLRILSLCAGVAGLDLGVAEALRRLAGRSDAARLDRLAIPAVGPVARTVGYCEHDAYAAAVLVRRINDGWLDDAPIWDDMESFDGRRWRGAVDCVIGGTPCTDISVAGGRAGITGSKSSLFHHFARIVGECRPGLIFWENVGGAATAAGNDSDPEGQPVDDPATEFVSDRALGVVLGSFSLLGFHCEWGTLPAGAVGAPHERKRLFVLGVADTGRAGECHTIKSEPIAGSRHEAGARGSGADMADADGVQLSRREAGDMVREEGRNPN